MNFVHDESEECTKAELDLFSVPPTQVSLEKGLSSLSRLFGIGSN